MAQTEAELLDTPVSGRPTLILRSPDFHSITEVVAEAVERKTPIGWWLFFLPSLALLGLLGLAISWLFWEGIGIWGLNVPVGWAWDITNFVFWVGIGHAGTLISAILFLFRQKWRTSINRAAEAMTIFAVMCALTFPGIHVGRVWVAYWMFPVPNQMSMCPRPSPAIRLTPNRTTVNRIDRNSIIPPAVSTACEAARELMSSRRSSRSTCLLMFSILLSTAVSDCSM